MSAEDTALSKLEQAIAHLERALASRAKGSAAGAKQIEHENTELRAALAKAKAAQSDLEERVRKVGTRLDGAIGELRAVLGA
jgi:Skp family chaperone for outer membrane proteins